MQSDGGVFGHSVCTTIALWSVHLARSKQASQCIDPFTGGSNHTHRNQQMCASWRASPNSDEYSICFKQIQHVCEDIPECSTLQWLLTNTKMVE